MSELDDEELKTYQLVDSLQRRTFGIDARKNIIKESLSKGLCAGCCHSFAYKVVERNDPVVICQYLQSRDYRVNGTIESCSGYMSKTTMSLHTMAGIAQLIDVDKLGVIGFKKEE